MRKVIVIGGGAAGMMAAIFAARSGADVTLLEKNDRLGKKLAITGKGRCNVTNHCELDEFLNNVPTNARFLYAAVTKFSPTDTMHFFESIGVPLKTERGKRVFPVSDRALDIVEALKRECKKQKVNIINDNATGISVINGKVTAVNCGKKEYATDAVILATGGKSYPTTGSDGSGYKLATSHGHTLTELNPSLIPLVCKGNLCPSMQGLSLKNVAIRFYEEGKKKPVYEDFGEMMFTHFGVTGPMILSASAHLKDISKKKYYAEIDLKPALDDAMLDKRLLKEFSENSNKDIVNILPSLLPQKMVEPFLKVIEMEPHKKANSISKEERYKILRTLKSFQFTPISYRPIEEAIITRGGISVKEIQPNSMESKLVKGMYFAGEIIDVDAYTGGFNLQIAFSTAVMAGTSAALE